MPDDSPIFVYLLLIFFITVTGTLKGYDQLLNLVLDEAVEFLRGKKLLFHEYVCALSLVILQLYMQLGNL